MTSNAKAVRKAIRKQIRQAYYRAPDLDMQLFINALRILVILSISISSISILIRLQIWLSESYDFSSFESASLIAIGFGIIDFFIRFFLLPLPAVDYFPYFLLPIAKKDIIRIQINRTFSSIWFFIFLLLGLSFLYFVFKQDLDLSYKIGFGIFAIGVIASNHLFSTVLPILDRRLKIGLYFFIGILIILSILQFRHYIDIIEPLAKISSTLFSSVIGFVVPLSVFIYLLIKSQSAFLNSFGTKPIEQFSRHTGIQFFNKWGKMGLLVDFHLNLIIRSKMVRNQLLYNLIFLLYPIIFDSSIDNIWGAIWMLYIFIPALVVSQTSFGWHTYHFENLLMHVDPIDLLWSKYYTAVITGLIVGIIGTILYYFFHIPSIEKLWVAFIYVMCVAVWPTIWYSIRYMYPIDIVNSSIFKSNPNFDFMVLLGMILIMVLFILLFYLGNRFVGEDYTVYLASILSLLILLSVPYWEKKCRKLLQQRKYHMIQSYRKFNS